MCDRCLQVSINRGASSLSELGGDTLGFPITQRVLSVEDRDSPDDSLLYVLSSAPSHGYIINRALGNRSISNWTQGKYFFLLTSLTAVSIVSCLSRLWVAFVCLLLLLLCVCFTLCLCLSHSLSFCLSHSLSVSLSLCVCMTVSPVPDVCCFCVFWFVLSCFSFLSCCYVSIGLLLVVLFAVGFFEHTCLRVSVFVYIDIWAKICSIFIPFWCFCFGSLYPLSRVSVCSSLCVPLSVGLFGTFHQRSVL